MSLTTAETATILGVPEPTIRKWVQRGKLQPRRRGTRPLTFDEAVVASFRALRWRQEQRRIGSRLGDACREFDRLVAAQVSGVSRSI